MSGRIFLSHDLTAIISINTAKFVKANPSYIEAVKVCCVPRCKPDSRGSVPHKLSNIIRRYTEHTKFGAYMAFPFITFFHVLLFFFFYRCIYRCM